MKTGRITVPRHGGRSHAFPLPGMLEPFFETGGLGRRGCGWCRVTRRRRRGQDLFLADSGPGTGHRWRRSPGHWTRRALGQAVACPYFLPEGP